MNAAKIYAGAAPGTPEPKAAKRMNKVARAAARLFSKQTYLATSMDEIAAAAKVSKGGMYYYFTTKAEVLFHIVDRVLDDLMHGLVDELRAQPDAHARLKYLISRHVGYYDGHLNEVRTLLNDRRCLDGKLADLIAAKEQAYFDIGAGIIAEWLGPHDSKRAPTTFALFGILNWIPGWYRQGGPATIETLTDLTYDLFVGGIEKIGKAHS